MIFTLKYIFPAEHYWEPAHMIWYYTQKIDQIVRVWLIVA